MERILNTKIAKATKIPEHFPPALPFANFAPLVLIVPRKMVFSSEYGT